MSCAALLATKSPFSRVCAEDPYILHEPPRGVDRDSTLPDELLYRVLSLDGDHLQRQFLINCIKQGRETTQTQK